MSGYLRRLVGILSLVGIVLTFSTVPAGAGSVDPTDAPTGGFTANFNGSVTVTYSGLTSPYVYMYPDATSCVDPEGGVPAQPLALLGGDYPVAASPAAIGVTTNVYNFSAPVAAPGSPLPAGTYSWCLFDMSTPGAFYLIADGGSIPVYPPVSSSIADNGNGSVIVTYANVNFDFSQMFYFYLFANQTSCPEIMDPSLPGFGFQTGFGLPDSPAAIGVGTLGTPLPLDESSFEAPALAPVTAGSYAACSYMTDSETGDLEFAQQLLVSIYTPTEPVVPAFTG